jgi:hypothetical protein
MLLRSVPHGQQEVHLEGALLDKPIHPLSHSICGLGLDRSLGQEECEAVVDDLGSEESREQQHQVRVLRALDFAGGQNSLLEGDPVEVGVGVSQLLNSQEAGVDVVGSPRLASKQGELSHKFLEEEALAQSDKLQEHVDGAKLGHFPYYGILGLRELVLPTLVKLHELAADPDC